MADILTQLQLTLDQLSTQFTASLAYTLTHSSPSSLPTTSSQPPLPSSTSEHAPGQSSNSGPPPPPGPDSPRTFSSSLQELASDLVVKTRQIEYLISVLPGLEDSKERQEERIRTLEREMQDVERERREVVREREQCVELLEGVLGGVRR